MSTIITPLKKPFLKWAGGKFRLLAVLQAHLPKRAYLIEPFVGAGALFLNTAYPKTILNDINSDLINLYHQLQNNGKKFISESKTLFVHKNNLPSAYYRIREAFNKTDCPWQRAIYFLYLNRHGYNGLCRYNLQGGYNVPFGDYQRPYFPQNELEFFCQRGKNISFRCQSYEALLTSFLNSKKLKECVFYCDPPYAPLSKTANFTGYAANRFTLDDQYNLAMLAKKLAKKGAAVLISNHDTTFTRQIYQGAKIVRLEVRRTISCQTSKREKVPEILAYFDSNSR